MGFRSAFSMRLVVSGVVLVLGLLDGAARAHRASAAISLCQTDPIVKLTNGTVVDLSASIYDSPSNVKSVSYTLHAPVGSRVAAVIYTAGPFTGKETLKFYADNQATTYTTTTLVTTWSSPISVTATTTVQAQSLHSGSASGHNKQELAVQIVT